MSGQLSPVGLSGAGSIRCGSLGRTQPLGQSHTQCSRENSAKTTGRMEKEMGQGPSLRSQAEIDEELAALAQPQLAVTHQWLYEIYVEPLS